MKEKPPGSTRIRLGRAVAIEWIAEPGIAAQTGAPMIRPLPGAYDPEEV